MRCRCAGLPDAFYLDEGPHGFGEGLVHEDAGNWIWLGSCPECGTLWAVDEWDKYSWPVVTRVEERGDFGRVDTTPKRKQLLLKSRGGLTDQRCTWAGCHQRAVRGVVYCLDHLWETGARR